MQFAGIAYDDNPPGAECWLESRKIPGGVGQSDRNAGGPPQQEKSFGQPFGCYSRQFYSRKS